MKAVFTIAQLEKLQKEGKIKGFQRPAPIETPNGKIVAKHFKKKSKEKEFISKNLFLWCQEKGLKLMEEYMFHVKRKWRSDWFIPELKIAIEYNGIMSAKSRHTTITGYSGDLDKINAAMGLGIRVIQFSPLNYTSLLTELNKLYDAGN